MVNMIFIINNVFKKKMIGSYKPFFIKDMLIKIKLTSKSQSLKYHVLKCWH